MKNLKMHFSINRIKKTTDRQTLQNLSGKNIFFLLITTGWIQQMVYCIKHKKFYSIFLRFDFSQVGRIGSRLRSTPSYLNKF